MSTTATRRGPNPDGAEDCGFPVAGDLPVLGARGMAELDLMIEDCLGITPGEMNEIVAGQVVTLARKRYLGGNPGGRRIVVLAGSGGNGGQALAVARHLAEAGAEVALALTARPERISEPMRGELARLEALGVGLDLPEGAAGEKADLIVDGLIGYGPRGAPRGRVADLIRWANAATGPVLSVDVPSGFDAAAGTLREPAISADATLTLGLPKRGLTAESLRHAVGALYLADLGIPPALYARMSNPLQVTAMGGNGIWRIMRDSEAAG